MSQKLLEYADDIMAWASLSPITTTTGMPTSTSPVLAETFSTTTMETVHSAT